MEWLNNIPFAKYQPRFDKVENLTPDNITKGIDEGLWISTSRQKTDNAVRVPLLQQALDIIEKYQKFINYN